MMMDFQAIIIDSDRPWPLNNTGEAINPKTAETHAS